MALENFILETEEGKVECEILITLYMDEYQKNYLVYTDNTSDENGELNLFISSFAPEDKRIELNDITDLKELEKVASQVEKIWREENGPEH